MSRPENNKTQPGEQDDAVETLEDRNIQLLEELSLLEEQKAGLEFQLEHLNTSRIALREALVTMAKIILALTQSQAELLKEQDSLNLENSVLDDKNEEIKSHILRLLTQNNALTEKDEELLESNVALQNSIDLLSNYKLNLEESNQELEEDISELEKENNNLQLRSGDLQENARELNEKVKQNRNN